MNVTDSAPQIEQDPTRNAAVILTVAGIAAALAIYYPIMKAMAVHWRAVPDHSHGFIVAPLALFFAWSQRDAITRARIEGSWWGVVPLGIGVLMIGFGPLGTLLPPLRAGLIFTIAGLVLLFLGREVFRILLFPLCFLFLMIPLPQSIVNTIAFPLQLQAASAAVTSLHLVGIPALLEGNIIHLAHTQLFVHEACAGLRSLMALITLGVVFAWFFQQGHPVHQVILVASTIPIAVVVNAFRVALTGALTHFYGVHVASGIIHEFQGVVTFTLAFAILMAESSMLNAISAYRKRRSAEAST